MNETQLPVAAPQRHRWPWVVLAFVIAFFLLAVIWMSFEVRRVQRIREANPPPASSAPAGR